MSHPRRRKSRTNGIVATLAVVHVLSGCPGVDRAGSATAELSPDLTAMLSDLELDGAEPKVAEKLTVLIARALSPPDSPEAWGALGMSLDIHGYDAEAIEVYRRTIELAEGEFRWPYFLAIALRERGDPEALRWFHRSRELRGDYVPLLARHGRALFDAGDLDAADATFARLLKADSSLSVAYLMLARSALARDDLETARDWLLDGLNVNPESGAIHAMLAEVYRHLGDMQDSELARIRARLFPEGTNITDPVSSELLQEAVSSRGLLLRGEAYLEAGQPEAALREFDAALEVRPTDPFVLDQRGRALQSLRRFEEAAEDHRAAVALLPTALVPRLNLASARFWQNRLAEAVAHADTARQLHPTSPQAYLSLGTYAHAGGDRPAAISAYSQGLRAAAFDPRIAVRLAWLLATSPQDGLRDGDAAARLAQVVCEIDGYRVPETLDVLAAANAESGNFSEAARVASVAHRLALATGKADLARGIEHRLTLYAAGRPYRE